MEIMKKHPVTCSLLLTMLLSLGLSLTQVRAWPGLAALPFTVIFVGLFLLYPFVLTVLNLVFCLRKPMEPSWRRAACHIEMATMILGVLLSLLLAAFADIDFLADWTATLQGVTVHSPVWPSAWPTVIFCFGTGFAGYVSLKLADFKKLPPLKIVVSLSAMYVGMTVSVLWIIQLFDFENLSFFFCLLPLNWIFICIRIIREKAADWRLTEESERRHFTNPTLEAVNRKVMDSALWPLWAFLLFWPLIGVCIMVLALFGQRPDNLIRAWTETSQWNLSRQISPPNLMYDGHYLCTVAACGHQKLVKPVRMGVRHGHRVVVNRQLCIANAFEQILEERSPRLHQNVRRFYDTCGFPVARLIRSPWASDVVYVLMKPLEWMFLAVIYLTDPRPEDRIRMQYIPPVPPAGQAVSL